MIGIFLGYSILQVLEFGFAAIVTAIKKCSDFLSKRIAESKDERPIATQSELDFQEEMDKDKKDFQNIEQKQDTIKRLGIDLEANVKLLTQEFMEMKRRMERYENFGQCH